MDTKNKVLADVSMQSNLLHRHHGTLGRCSNFLVAADTVFLGNNGLSFRTVLQNHDRAANWLIWNCSHPCILFHLAEKRSLFSGFYCWDTKDHFQNFCNQFRRRQNRSDCYYPKRTRNSIPKIAFSCVHSCAHASSWSLSLSFPYPQWTQLKMLSDVSFCSAVEGTGCCAVLLNQMQCN